MTARIYYSVDGEKYFCAKDGFSAHFWMSLETEPGHADHLMQQKAVDGGSRWINVSTKDGTQYRRRVYDLKTTDLWASHIDPIEETDIRLKDYALFHRW